MFVCVICKWRKWICGIVIDFFFMWKKFGYFYEVYGWIILLCFFFVYLYDIEEY